MKKLLFNATKKDFKIDTFCTGGPGGQNQNRKKMGIRITHIPTGLSTECRETKSQDTNKQRAFRKLANLLITKVRRELVKEFKRSNETIRTYNEPDNRVKDSASGLVQSYREVVIDGVIEEMVEHRRRKLSESV